MKLASASAFNPQLFPTNFHSAAKQRNAKQETFQFSVSWTNLKLWKFYEIILFSQQKFFIFFPLFPTNPLQKKVCLEMEWAQSEYTHHHSTGGESNISHRVKLAFHAFSIENFYCSTVQHKKDLEKYIEGGGKSFASKLSEKLSKAMKQIS